MPTRRETRLLTRAASQNGVTLHFTAENLGGRSGRCRLTFIDPQHVPAFEGEQAWFELERVPASPWPYWRAIRQVEPPAGWRPDPPRPRPTPAQLLGHRS